MSTIILLPEETGTWQDLAYHHEGKLGFLWSDQILMGKRILNFSREMLCPFGLNVTPKPKLFTLGSTLIILKVVP